MKQPCPVLHTGPCAFCQEIRRAADTCPLRNIDLHELAEAVIKKFSHHRGPQGYESAHETAQFIEQWKGGKATGAEG